MLLARIAADEAEILTLAVVPAVRRRGIAHGLLTAALAEFSRLAIGSVFLEVSVRNTAAAALYASLGFTQVGERAHYYSDGSAASVLKFSLCE
jgi:ribosomal-protein-alanine N-acetyltransferase